MQFTKALQHTIGWKTLNTFLTFFVNLLLVRILGADGSGDFFYSIALLSFFTLLISWSMEAGITYFGTNNIDSLPSLTMIVIPLLMIQALAGWLLLYFIPVNIGRQPAWLYMLSNLVIIYFSALYYAKKWFVSFNVIVSISNCIVLVALGWVYATYGNNREGLFYLFPGKMIRQPGGFFNSSSNNVNPESFYFAGIAYFGGFLLQAVVLAIIFIIKSRIKLIAPVYNPLLTRNIFRYSSIAFISNILFFLVTRIDYYFVQKYCDEISLGNYVQVAKLGQLLILLPSMMAGVIFPYSAGPDNKGYLGKLQSLCRIIGLLFIPAAITIILAGYWIFPWLFGTGFGSMYPAMLFYLPGFYCLSLVTLLAAHLAGRAMIIQNLTASVIALAAVITGDVIFIPAYGIYAAAAVSSIAYFFCMVYLLWIYKKNLGCKTADFFATGKNDIQLLFSRVNK